MENSNSLKNNVQRYIDLDDQIKEINKSTKDIKEQKKVVEEAILDQMRSNNIDQINLGDSGKLKLVKTKTFEAVKKEIIFEKLSEKMTAEKAQEITETIINSRKASENTKIQRK